MNTIRTKVLAKLWSLSVCLLFAPGVVSAHPAVGLSGSSHSYALTLIKALAPHRSVHVDTAMLLTKSSTQLFAQRAFSSLPIARVGNVSSATSSLAMKQASAIIKMVVTRGFIAGVGRGASQVQVAPQSPIGGTVSGQLQGDLYVLQGNGAVPLYVNSGEFKGVIGNNIAANFSTTDMHALGSNVLDPTYQNILTFPAQNVTYITVNSSKGISIGGVGPGFLPLLATGSQRRFLFGLAKLTASSVAVGTRVGFARALADEAKFPTFSGGSVSGGIFYGTAYRNSLSSSAYVSYPFTLSHEPPSYVFAIGNNPLNNPGGIFQTVAIPTQNS